MPTEFNSRYSMADWNSETNEWYVALAGDSKIIKMKAGAEETGQTWVKLPRSIISFVRTAEVIAGTDSDSPGEESSKTIEFVYYCSSSDGKIYKYNLTSKIEIPLSWPSSTFKCTGRSIKYDANRKAVIFPYIQNNLSGVAEILNE